MEEAIKGTEDGRQRVEATAVRISTWMANRVEAGGADHGPQENPQAQAPDAERQQQLQEVADDQEGHRIDIGGMDIAEIYSPRRVTNMADFGLNPGDALNIKTGWDFSKAQVRRQAWD